MNTQRIFFAITLFFLASASLCGEGFKNLVHASDLEQELKQADHAVIKFTLSTCPPCKRMEPIEGQIASSYVRIRKNRFRKFFSKIFKKRSAIPKKALQPIFYSVDIAAHPMLAQAHKIRATPTYLFMKNNKEIMRITGAMTKDRLEAAVQSFLMK